MGFTVHTSSKSISFATTSISSLRLIKNAKALANLLAAFYTLTIVSLVAPEEVTLTILHTNDVHSRFLQTNKYGGPCPNETSNKCYGGFARLHYKAKEIRASHKNVLYLSGGDYYQGTIWYTLHKWRIVSKFVNILNHTAMAFGNHEFDDGIVGVLPFLEAATFPVIACNIDDSLEPTIQGKYKKSVVVEVEGGRKVGIIGYTTEETAAISKPGRLIFKDIVQSIKDESERLDKEGVEILIAVGHAGYEVDQKIAKEVPLIDAVVGGHSNTFLYNGTIPDIDKTFGDYPTIITQSNGRRVPVVQAFAFGKYLGYLNLTVNDEGEVVQWSGNPILLNHKVPRDPEILKEIRVWEKNISHYTKLEIGKTKVFLDGSTNECRMRECNLGNLVTDAMVYDNLRYPDELYWSDVTMAILHSGGIRSSIDERLRNGSITMEDIRTAFPFQDTIDLVEIKGKHLRLAFEHAVKGYDPKGHHLPGKFLQVSGIKVVYDLAKPDGSKVKQIKVLCKACRVPSYGLLDDKTVYKVAVPSFLVRGGEGFEIIKNNILQFHFSGIVDTDMLIDYIQSKGVVAQAVEGRITFDSSSCV